MDEPEQRLVSLTLKLLEHSQTLDFKRAKEGPIVKPEHARKRLEKIKRVTHELYTAYQAPVLVPQCDHLVRTSQPRDLKADKEREPPKMREKIGLHDMTIKGVVNKPSTFGVHGAGKVGRWDRGGGQL